MNDDKITQAAQQLATDVTPERDLWSGIAAAIEAPERRRWTPMLAQAAVVPSTGGRFFSDNLYGA